MTTLDSPIVLSATRLAFTRLNEPVFGPLDLRVQRGEVLLVTGDNGAGKTTLLRVLCGLLPHTGDVQWFGQPGAAPTSQLAYAGHLPAHKAELTCLENLRFASALHGSRRDIGPVAALASVGLSGFEDSFAGGLSAGQRKRLGLARLLLSTALLWLLDEPYANLDRDGITLVDRMLRRHLAGGGAALLTTHGAYAAPPVPTRTLALSRQDAAVDSSSLVAGEQP
ncbi:MAG: heme ABC exporter ATP-binding protein CcmA [Lysobacteraceae bacterium]